MRQKIFNLFNMTMFVLFVLTSCGHDDYSQVNEFLSLDYPEEMVGAEGGTVVVVVESNAEWEALEGESYDWLELDKTSGISSDILKVDIKANPTNKERSGVLTIKSKVGVLEATVNIAQARGVNRLFPESQVVVFEKDDIGEKVVNVTTNLEEWEVSTSENWVHASKQGESIVITVADLAGVEYRSATIALIGEDKQKMGEITIYQAEFENMDYFHGYFYGDKNDNNTTYLLVSLYQETPENIHQEYNHLSLDLYLDFYRFSELSLNSGAYPVDNSMDVNTMLIGHFQEVGDALQISGCFGYAVTKATGVSQVSLLRSGFLSVEEKDGNHILYVVGVGQEAYTGAPIDVPFFYKYEGKPLFENQLPDPRTEVITNFTDAGAKFDGDFDWMRGDNWGLLICYDGVTLEPSNQSRGEGFWMIGEGGVIHLDIVAPPDMGDRYIPDGTYIASDNGSDSDPFTFTTAYSYYRDIQAGGMIEDYIIDGKVVIQRTGEQYSIDFEVKTEKELTLKGKYEGTAQYARR